MKNKGCLPCVIGARSEKQTSLLFVRSLDNKINDKKIVIFGSGGHGKVVLDILLCSGQKILGFLNEDLSKKETKIRGFKILGSWEYFEKNKKVAVALGVGNNEARYRIYNRVKDLGCDLVTAVHPKAIISRDVKIGQGAVIMPGVVINPGTVIEDGCVVNTGATVDHDCRLKKFSQVWPGAHLAGGVELGEFSYIGTGASVIQNIKIGENVIIGAGAAVIRNVQDNVVAAGVPAKIIRDKKNNSKKQKSTTTNS